MSRPIASAILALVAVVATASSATGDAPLPRDLRDTGIGAPGTMAFAPQYPLWTDGMDKRRWLYLPAGTAIDKSNPDRWEFPAGTRAWKEFRDGARVETRFIERLRDGTWRYATYVWNAAGTQALLAPDDGIPARGIPSRIDCLACHEGAAVPILGYSAVQQSPDGIAAPSATARAALGYLHGNCGHCHNENALPALDLALAQEAARPAESAARTVISLVGRYSRFRAHGAPETRRVVPGDPARGVLLARMKSHDPLVRMPPLGVQVADTRGIETLARWIREDLQPNQETAP